MTVIGGLCGAIVALFWQVLKAKDSFIADQKDTIRYQRQVIDHALSTAHRGVDLATERSGS